LFTVYTKERQRGNKREEREDAREHDREMDCFFCVGMMCTSVVFASKTSSLRLLLCPVNNFHNKYLHHPIHCYLARSLSLALILCVLIPQKKAFSENTYSDGALGIAQRANPGDWSPDMMKVTELSREIGGYGDKEIFQMMMLGQGFRSYIVAEDRRTGEIVGCAQLTRIQVLSLLALLVRK
jgi:hypothetical protein